MAVRRTLGVGLVRDGVDRLKPMADPKIDLVDIMMPNASARTTQWVKV